VLRAPRREGGGGEGGGGESGWKAEMLVAFSEREKGPLTAPSRLTSLSNWPRTAKAIKVVLTHLIGLQTGRPEFFDELATHLRNCDG